MKGVYDIEVESRATHRPGGFGLKLASDSEFTILDVPNQGATATKHFNVWLPFRKSVRLDGEKLVFRCTGKAAYIDALKFILVSRFKKFQPLAENELGPATGVICKQPGRYIGWPTIARTSKGELIVTFSGDRDAHVCPWGKTQMVRSRDNGKTWDLKHEITLADAPDGDLGYPASTQLSDGSILTIYYQKDQPDEKPCLMGTHWRLPMQRQTVCKAPDNAGY